MSSFSFNGFTLRSACSADRTLAEIWTKADPDHRRTDPAFWYEQFPGIESYLLEDQFGPVFFFKMMRTQPGEIELHIQFPPTLIEPGAEGDRRYRVMAGLMRGLEWIERVISLRGVHVLCFESKNPALIRFSVKRLGFKIEGKRLIKPVGKEVAQCAGQPQRKCS